MREEKCGDCLVYTYNDDRGAECRANPPVLVTSLSSEDDGTINPDGWGLWPRVGVDFAACGQFIKSE